MVEVQVQACDTVCNERRLCLARLNGKILQNFRHGCCGPGPLPRAPTIWMMLPLGPRVSNASLSGVVMIFDCGLEYTTHTGTALKSAGTEFIQSLGKGSLPRLIGTMRDQGL